MDEVFFLFYLQKLIWKVKSNHRHISIKLQTQFQNNVFKQGP